MEYCKNCGNKLKEDAQFCGECGTAIKISEDTSAQSGTQVLKKLTPKQKKKMAIIAISTLLLLFVGHQLFQFVFSKERLINSFEEALLENNSKKMAKLLTADDKKLEVDEKAVEGFMKYFEENPEQITATVSMLKQQSDSLDTNKEDKSELENFAENFFELNMVQLDHNGTFLFYDKYQLSIPTVYVEIETNYKDTKLYVDGEEIGEATEPDYKKTFGPFLPGIHKIEAVLNSDIVDLKYEEEIFISGAVSKDFVYAQLEAEEVTFVLPNDGSTNEIVKLYINGKDTEINLLETPTFGPVLLDGSMTWQVETELPWGTIKTEEQPITDDYIYVSYVTTDLRDSIINTVHEYLSQMPLAYTTLDTSNVTTATERVKEWIIEEANDEKEYEIASKIQYLSSSFDLGSISVSYKDGQWTADVSAMSYYNQDEFYVGNQPELTEDTITRSYDLIYDEKSKKWLVDYFSYIWFFSDDNLKELKVENPEVYTSTWAAESTDS